MVDHPIDRVVKEVEAEKAEFLAQLPADVRRVIDEVANADGRKAITNALCIMKRHPDRGWQMFALGTLNYALRVEHLTQEGYEVLSAYEKTLRQ